MKLSGAIAFVLLATTHASTKHHQLHKEKALELTTTTVDTSTDQFDLKKSLQYNTHKQDDIVHRNLSLDQLEKLQNDMNDAIASGDYIKAGELQKQFNALTKLQNDMNDAVASGNYIKAGELQKQFNALTNNTMSSTSATTAATTASTTEDDRSSNDTL